MWALSFSLLCLYFASYLGKLDSEHKNGRGQQVFVSYLHTNSTCIRSSLYAMNSVDLRFTKIDRINVTKTIKN